MSDPRSLVIVDLNAYLPTAGCTGHIQQALAIDYSLGRPLDIQTGCHLGRTQDERITE